MAAAVDWIGVNQAPDGTFLYRYDRSVGEVVPGYNTVRHAGTLLALEQARAAGVEAADEPAERGLDWALGQLEELRGGRVALTGETGASALLVTALAERRLIDGPRAAEDDEVLLALGRFLLGTVTERGGVVAAWDLEADEPVVGSTSPFFTGEVLWALARLHVAFPDGGWDEPARKVAHYLAVERDDAERRFPPVSDHWASYAFAEMSAWPEGSGLGEPERAYARRQAGLFGVQARFEAQRRPDGPVRQTRGPVALTAGIATVGEGLGGIWRLTSTEPDLALDEADVTDRLACVASLLVARQADSDDPRIDGAWFRADVTQVDDEQHAISALLAALVVLEDPA